MGRKVNCVTALRRVWWSRENELSNEQALRYTGTDREIDRQTKRQTDRQTDRQQTDRHVAILWVNTMKLNIEHCRHSWLIVKRSHPSTLHRVIQTLRRRALKKLREGAGSCNFPSAKLTFKKHFFKLSLWIFLTLHAYKNNVKFTDTAHQSV